MTETQQLPDTATTPSSVSFPGRGWSSALYRASADTLLSGVWALLGGTTKALEDVEKRTDQTCSPPLALRSNAPTADPSVVSEGSDQELINAHTDAPPTYADSQAADGGRPDYTDVLGNNLSAYQAITNLAPYAKLFTDLEISDATRRSIQAAAGVSAPIADAQLQAGVETIYLATKISHWVDYMQHKYSQNREAWYDIGSDDWQAGYRLFKEMSEATQSSPGTPISHSCAESALTCASLFNPTINGTHSLAEKLNTANATIHTLAHALAQGEHRIAELQAELKQSRETPLVGNHNLPRSDCSSSIFLKAKPPTIEVF